jgi:16S rRNA (uracil1498-N3)-methyltransferase
MRLIRVFVEATLTPGGRVELAGSAYEHLTRVLRLGAGDAVTLFNGGGHDHRCVIAELRRGRAVVDVGAAAPARAESPLAVALDLVIQKATELGATAIRPVATERSVVRLDAAMRAKRLAHWRGIMIAACEQCGRARLPELAEPVPLVDWLSRPAPPGWLRLQLDPAAPETLPARAAGAPAIELLVGPEGGLTAAEQDAARQTGYRSCRLGPRVLRSETAAIAALAVLQATAGDLR